MIGGGPAGLAAALRLTAPPEISVVLLERDEKPRVKIGETVPPEIRSVLEQLGVWEPFLAGGHLPGWGTSSCWGSSNVGYNDFLFQTGGCGWHLDRARFESMLEREAVARGIHALRGASLRGAVEVPGGWSLAACTEAGEQRFQARMVVDASGRRAVFAHRQGAHRLTFDSLAGACRFFQQSKERPLETGLSLVEAVEAGWWYSAALPGERIVACFMTDADLLRQLRIGDDGGWWRQAALTGPTVKRLEDAASLDLPRIQSAASSLLEPVVGKRWLAVGDAASTFDPLSSRGILKALLSGVRAADAVCRVLAGDPEALAAYSRGVESEMKRYLEIRRLHYATERRWPEAPFWRRRQPPEHPAI